MTIAAEEVGLERPYTYDELAEADPAVGALAFDVDNHRQYVVLAEGDEPAGEYPIGEYGPRAELVDCEPDEDVYLAVSIEVLRNKAEDWRSLDHILEALEEGRIVPRAVPSSRIAPLPREWADEVRR